MEENLNYYFEDETFHENLFKKCTYTYEPLLYLKEYIDSLVTTKNIIGRNVKIHDNVIIEDHVIIGDNVEIMSHAYIRPYSIIGSNCVIGHCAEIKHSIIFPKAKVQSLTFVGDSIIGTSTRIGSGTIISNRRFDQKEIGVKINGKYCHLKSDFFGSIIGDSSRLGANCSCLPGTHIGKYTFILPMNRIKGFIPSLKLVDKDEITDKIKTELI